MMRNSIYSASSQPSTPCASRLLHFTPSQPLPLYLSLLHLLLTLWHSFGSTQISTRVSRGGTTQTSWMSDPEFVAPSSVSLEKVIYQLSQPNLQSSVFMLPALTLPKFGIDFGKHTAASHTFLSNMALIRGPNYPVSVPDALCVYGL